MKAVRVERFGTPDTFALTETERPPLSENEVRIEVCAAGISFVDLLYAQGKYQVQPKLPFTPGAEFSGTILEIGLGVSDLTVGDRVIAAAMGGAYAQECVVPARAARKIPDEMSFIDASVFRVSYGTAYHALVQRAEVKPNETVLVLGAAGAVGSACIQVASALGARVIASASTPQKRELARACGAAEAIDTNADDWRDQVKALTSGKGVDIVADPVGGEATERAFRSLAWKGRHLVIGFAQGTIPSLPVNLALLKGAALIGVDIRQFGLFEAELADANLTRLFELYEAGGLRPPIARTYPLSALKTAMNDVLEGSALGRIVLTPNAS